MQPLLSLSLVDERKAFRILTAEEKWWLLGKANGMDSAFLFLFQIHFLSGLSKIRRQEPVNAAQESLTSVP